MKALDLGMSLFEAEVLPLVRKGFPHLVDRLAAGAMGAGSDTQGLDDETSRDHHWGPRANLLLYDEDYEADGDAFREYLAAHLPESYQGHPVQRIRHDGAGVSVEAMGAFFRKYTGFPERPENESDWFQCCEPDLYHATSGVVFYDPSGELTRRRDGFLAYYPDNIWKKKIADWCLYVTGSPSAYNIHRCHRRGDMVSAYIFYGNCLKRQIELAFLLNRCYFPYTKWLHRVFLRLPKLVDQLEPMIQANLETGDWAEKVQWVIGVNHLYALELWHMGLTTQPQFKPFDPSLTDLILYESALELYQQIPAEMLHARFNEVEHWEVLAREVLFDTSDYFQKKFKA